MSNENSTEFQVTAAFEALRYLVFRGMRGKDGADGTDGKSLRVNEQGHIIYWNDETQQWVDTGIEAEGAPGPQGEPGFSPTVSVSAITGGHRVTITDEDGAHPFDVLDGEDGSPGAKLLNFNYSTNAVTDYVTGDVVTQTQIKDFIDSGVFVFLYINDAASIISRWIPFKSYSSSGAVFEMEGLQVRVVTNDNLTQGIFTIEENFLPIVDEEDKGKVLTVNDQGRWGISIPRYTLRVKYYVAASGTHAQGDLTVVDGNTETAVTGRELANAVANGYYPVVTEAGTSYPRIYKPEVVLTNTMITFRSTDMNGSVSVLNVLWNASTATQFSVIGDMPTPNVPQDVGKVVTVNSSGGYTLQTPSGEAYTLHLTGNATNGYQITESAADIMARYPNLVLREEAGSYDDEYFLVGAVVDFDGKHGYLQFTRDDLSFTDGTVYRAFVHISIGWDPARPSSYGTYAYKGETYLRNLPQASNAQNGKLLGVVGGNYAFVTPSTNTLYYIDGTVIKDAVNNVTKTGQQIYNETVPNGVCPVVYRHDSAANVADQFFFQRWDSAGMHFQTLDGRQQLYLPWGETTFTRYTGYNNAIYYLDGTTVKSAATNLACTAGDITAASLRNGVVPVIKQEDSQYTQHYFHLFTSSSGGLEFRLLDGTKKLTMAWNSSTATITDL